MLSCEDIVDGLKTEIPHLSLGEHETAVSVPSWMILVVAKHLGPVL